MNVVATISCHESAQCDSTTTFSRTLIRTRPPGILPMYSCQLVSPARALQGDGLPAIKTKQTASRSRRRRRNRAGDGCIARKNLGRRRFRCCDCCWSWEGKALASEQKQMAQEWVPDAGADVGHLVGLRARIKQVRKRMAPRDPQATLSNWHVVLPMQPAKPPKPSY